MRLALQEGCEVEVVCFEFNNWSYAFNQQIMQEFKEAKVHIIQAGRKPFLPWAVSVFLEQFLRVTARVIPLKGWALSQSVSRRTYLLIRKIKTLAGNFDMVVGHNPGALYPTYFAGKRFQSKTGFDVEDYHPGETNDDAASGRIKRLMKALLPELNYLTFASAPIRSEVEKFADVKGEVIMNWFCTNEFDEPEKKTGKLKLVWFSQNISFNRGLEMVIPVVEKLDDVELNLFGNCNADFQKKYLLHLKHTFLHPAISQQDLHKKLNEFDVGLAIEPKKDLNNELAISNKILAYFQSGLFIIASDTLGQKFFLKNHPEHGIVVNLHADLKNRIENLIQIKKEIRNGAAQRFYAARSYGWERGAEKLLEVWNLVTKQMDAEHHRQRISSW